MAKINSMMKYYDDECPLTNQEILKSWLESNSLLSQKFKAIKGVLYNEEQIDYLKQLTNGKVIVVHPVCPTGETKGDYRPTGYEAQCLENSYIRIYSPLDCEKVSLEVGLDEKDKISLVIKDKPSCTFRNLDYEKIFTFLQEGKNRCYFRSIHPFASSFSPELWLLFTIDQFLDIVQGIE